MRTVRLTVEYDGTPFSGFVVQRVPPGVRTVQAELETALNTMTRESLTIRYASRTDAGVHARGQVVAFDTTRDEISLVGFARGLTSLMPEEIVIREAQEAEAGWDPRRTSRGKRYLYTWWNAPQPSAIERRTSWWIREPLDVEAMQRAADVLLGTHDFESFRSSTCDARHARRHLHRVTVERGAYARVHLTVVGNAFVKNMVRVIAGTLSDVGRGRSSPEAVKEILEARDCTRAGITAPAQGLCLEEVIYDDRLPQRH